MEEYQLEDEQRERAVAYLEQEHARGALDEVELTRRTAEVRSARTVAQLLAATADPAVQALEPKPRAVPGNRSALLVGLLVAALVLLLLVAASVYR
jgi:DUF1707 SHOCT-like domain